MARYYAIAGGFPASSRRGDGVNGIRRSGSPLPTGGGARGVAVGGVPADAMAARSRVRMPKLDYVCMTGIYFAD